MTKFRVLKILPSGSIPPSNKTGYCLSIRQGPFENSEHGEDAKTESDCSIGPYLIESDTYSIRLRFVFLSQLYILRVT